MKKTIFFCLLTLWCAPLLCMESGQQAAQSAASGAQSALHISSEERNLVFQQVVAAFLANPGITALRDSRSGNTGSASLTSIAQNAQQQEAQEESSDEEEESYSESMPGEESPKTQAAESQCKIDRPTAPTFCPPAHCPFHIFDEFANGHDTDDKKGKATLADQSPAYRKWFEQPAPLLAAIHNSHLREGWAKSENCDDEGPLQTQNMSFGEFYRLYKCPPEWIIDYYFNSSTPYPDHNTIGY